mgnify:CR=1 FL=1
MRLFIVLAQVLILSTIFFSVLYFVDQAPDVDPHYTISEVERLDSFSELPPENESGWQQVTLPHFDRIEDSNYASTWYRFRFERSDFKQSNSALDSRWAVFVTSNTANSAVFLNGAFLGNGGNTKPPVPAYRRPQMYTFPASLVQERGNVLYYHYINGLPQVDASPIYIGPVSKFDSWYSNTMFMKKSLRSAVITLMLVITVIMLMMFILRPQDKMFGWYAASTTVWTIHYGMRMIDQLPFENLYLVNAFSYLTLGLFAFFASQYIACITEIRNRVIDKIILAWCVIGGSLLIIIAQFWEGSVDDFGATIWMPSALLAGCYSVGVLALAVARNNTVENRLLLVSIGLLLLTGFRDYLYQFSDLVPGSTYYLQFGAGFVMTVWAIILMRRFALALDSAEILNSELELRVAEKTNELQAFYTRAAKTDREQALVQERERIMRDMHDGLGGQLVQLLSLADQDPKLLPVRDTLRRALRDLRLIIDSLSVNDGDLVTVLGTFRYRTEKMIKDAGLKYDWQVEDVPALSSMGPASALQVLRILQEAVSNIIQHAQASTIVIRTLIGSTGPGADPAVIVEVQDDGKGFSVNEETYSSGGANARGHGLANMQFRAKKTGGQVIITSGDEGTTVRIELPLD